MDPAILSRIALDLSLPESSVAAAVGLFEKGATAPFITRYRKEATGGINALTVCAIEERLTYYQEVLERRAGLLKLASDQKRLTNDLRQGIEKAISKVELDDLGQLLRPKRKTRGSEAQERGLEPLAEYLWNQETDAWSLEEHADVFISAEKQVATREQALQGACDIIAEWVSENLEIRSRLREMFWKDGVIVSTVVPAKAAQKTKYTMYYNRREPAAHIPSHRVLAIRRGSKEGVLTSAIECDQARAIELIVSLAIKDKESIFTPILDRAIRDSYSRILRPVIETQVRALLKERADREAIRVFQDNLTNLLLTPPAGSMAVLGIDVGRGDEAKFAVIDPNGDLLEEAIARLKPPRQSQSAPLKAQKAAVEQVAPAAESLEMAHPEEAAPPAESVPIPALIEEAVQEPDPAGDAAPLSEPAQEPVLAEEAAQQPAPAAEEEAAPPAESAPIPATIEEAVQKPGPAGEAAPLSEPAQEPVLAEEAAQQPAPAAEEEAAPPAESVAIPATIEEAVQEPDPAGDTAPLSEPAQEPVLAEEAVQQPAPVAETAAESMEASAAQEETVSEAAREPAVAEMLVTESEPQPPPPAEAPVETLPPPAAEEPEISSALVTASPKVSPLAVAIQVESKSADEEHGAGPATQAISENYVDGARTILRDLINRHSVKAVAIGNSTAARNLEGLVRQILADEKIDNVLITAINDAGVAIYSSSRIAREELPEKSTATRCAISLARRLQDPLAELAKVDPKLIGVGQYQHDVDQKELHRGLVQTVRSCVNHVGVDLNSAGFSLLRYVSGLNDKSARKIIATRGAKGPFPSRASLLEVPGIDAHSYEQAAGFLRIRVGDNPLDGTTVHPESYPLVEKMAAALAVGIDELIGNKERISGLKLEEFVTETAGLPTLNDIRDELLRPGRDPRKTFKIARFRDDVKQIGDLKEGMTLEGTVTNVTNFGAFVDVGVHQDGLVHLSQMSNRFIRDPREAVKVGDVVQVKVISVEMETKRIGLSIKALLPPLVRRRKKPHRRVTPAAPLRNAPRAPGAAAPPSAADPGQDAAAPADGQAAPSITPAPARRESGRRDFRRPETGRREGGRPEARRREPGGRERDRRPAPRREERRPDKPAESQEPPPAQPQVPEPTLQEKIAILQSKFRGIS